MTVFADPTFTANYQGLCNKIADTLNRQDLTSVIPDFTVFATSRIERDMARLKHPLAISRAIATVQNNYVPLPIDYLSVYQMMDQDTSKVLDYVSPDQSKEVLASGWGGTSGHYTGFSPSPLMTSGPIYYTIVGNQLRIFPPPGVNAPVYLDLWYYARLSVLSTGNPTNWAITRYPDLYLYGSLVHTAPYLKNDERIQTWEGSYQTILRDIEVEADRAVRTQSKLNSARKSF
jgi:hypothetical protein